MGYRQKVPVNWKKVLRNSINLELINVSCFIGPNKTPNKVMDIITNLSLFLYNLPKLTKAVLNIKIRDENMIIPQGFQTKVSRRSEWKRQNPNYLKLRPDSEKEFNVELTNSVELVPKAYYIKDGEFRKDFDKCLNDVKEKVKELNVYQHWFAGCRNFFKFFRYKNNKWVLDIDFDTISKFEYCFKEYCV